MKAGWWWVAAALLGAAPLAVHAQPATPASVEPIVVPPPPPNASLPPVEPIVPDAEFKAAVPAISPEDDPELAKPLEPVEVFERLLSGEHIGPSQPATMPATAIAAPLGDVELNRPLPPLETFEVKPAEFTQVEEAPGASGLAYQVRLNGMDEAEGLSSRFRDASALRSGKRHAANLAQISSRIGEDTVLLKRLLASQGWFDPQITSRIERSAAADGQPLTVVFDVMPGRRFAFASITVEAAPTVPPGLIGDSLNLAVGQPVVAEEVLGAEARVALALPQGGYPFAELGQREILLDQDSGGADYTLPVTVGPRGSFGSVVSEGKQAFDARHIQVLARFKPGQLYDSRLVDDLRQALIATGLFKGIAVEPRPSGQPGPDGTEQVTVAVKQEAGPQRVIAVTGGYGTGEGLKVEGSWTHRNLFPPEGALILSGVAGTRDQGGGVTFRRANAGRRDRTFELAADFHHASTDAFSANTGRLSGKVTYDSTPLWQKRLTYAYGGELIGTSESLYDPALGQRVRRSYAIAGLTGEIGLDSTDNLLDPKKGYRLTALVEPEGSLHGKLSPYVRLRLDGSYYYQASDSIVLAARARVASIQGAALGDLAPSRRLYAGGGGSVRGFGFQQLGPRDPNNDPIGARSLNEAAFEVRYRFGDYGVVAFADLGQAYVSSTPQFSHLRAGVGLGARLYTNFGPIRIDLATPLQRRAGESRINVYVSIGQAF